MLGAGGSARAAVWALKRAGAIGRDLEPDPEKAQRLAAKLGVAVESTGSRSDDADGRYVVEGGEFDLLVNCTTVGLASASESTDLEPLPLDADSVRDTHVVVDLAYGPSPTPLIAAAASRGARVVDGLDVLVHQGAASLRIWTGRNPPLEAMRRTARERRTAA